MLKIANLTLKSKLIMAPMSGCTDMPFRKVIRSFGCRFCFYEMLDASGLIHSHKKTLSMLKTFSADEPIGAQILGSDHKKVVEAAHIVLAHSNPVLIDLNCGCPAKKVLKKKAGAYLIKDPKTAGKIIKKLRASFDLPITIKIRSGWSQVDSQEGLKLAKIAQDNGADAVFMHGRTVKQGYSGQVNYDAIAQIKKALRIPVIGSGDIYSAELAKLMLDRTKCDGLLVARGALGRPWIFNQIQASLDKKKVPSAPSLFKIKRIAQKHVKSYYEWKASPAKYTIGRLRKIAMWYFRGQIYATIIRNSINSAQSYKEIIKIIDRI